MAAAGKLIFSMAGPEATIDRLRPYIVSVMGKSIINMGEDVRQSSLLKIAGYAVFLPCQCSPQAPQTNLCRNVFVVGLQELVAEAQVFADKTGLGTGRLEEFIGSMYGPVLESYSKRMTTGAYAPPLDTKPGFAAALAAKDAGHALSIAKAHGTRIPTLETAHARLTAAREYAGESIDSAAVYGVARMEAGLPFWSENSRQGN